MSKKCKNCDRPVQPGLTKMMTEYDTCCRSCAKYPGQGKHDPNCGGAGGDQTPYCKPVPTQDPSKLMKSLVNDYNQLSAYASKAFQKTAQGHSRLGYAQLRTALKIVMEPFGGLSPSMKVGKLKQEFDADEDGMINEEEFVTMCAQVFSEEGERWFPMLLPVATTSFVINNPNELEDVYHLGKKLGEGTFGKVYLATHQVSGEQRVCKKVSIAAAGMDTAAILVEISNMAQLDHPNVVKVYEWFEDDEDICQIMEPLGGGELFDRIQAVFKDQTMPFYGEAFIADVIKQTLRALAFMHSKRFMHKDLKPQNIMMVDKSSSSIKVIDFGLAEMFVTTQETAMQFGGTLLYTAPEGAKMLMGLPDAWGFQGLVFKSDIWSTGVILHELITGGYPFAGAWTGDQNAWQAETLQKIIRDPMPQNPYLGQVSSGCRKLMGQMLEKEVGPRPDANQCLSSSWFSSVISAPAPLSPGIMQSLYSYSEVTEMKRAMFLLMAHLSAMPAVSQLREIYTHFDVRNKGTLNLDDLRKVLGQGGFKPFAIHKVTQALDRSGSGEIGWTEFLAGALCFKLANSRRLIDAAYAFYDEDGMGVITQEAIENKLAVAPAPSTWATLWVEHLPAQLETAKEECEDDDGNQEKGSCGFLCPPPEPEEDEMTKELFQTWMAQKLREKSGKSFFSVS